MKAARSRAQILNVRDVPAVQLYDYVASLDAGLLCRTSRYDVYDNRSRPDLAAQLELLAQSRVGGIAGMYAEFAGGRFLRTCLARGRRQSRRGANRNVDRALSAAAPDDDRYPLAGASPGNHVAERCVVR